MIYVAIGIVYLVINIILASVMQSLAEAKGYTERTTFWLTFVFGIIGVLYVIALPDLKEREQREDILAVLLELKERGKTDGNH